MNTSLIWQAAIFSEICKRARVSAREPEENMLQDDCIKNELSLDEDDGPIPELVDDQESDDEDTNSSMPELVHLDAIEVDEEVLGPIRLSLVSREVLDNHTECCNIRLPLPVYLCSGKKCNNLWGAGQRGTSRLPSLQTGEPTAEWEAKVEDFIGVYSFSGKKYNDCLWGAGQRGTSRLPSLQTGEPTAEWEV